MVRYRDGFRCKVPPHVAAEALAELQAKYGRLIPADVVAEAREATSPLHPAFEWDDNSAGEKWREHQARSLIRAVVVTAGSPAPDSPVYICVPRIGNSPAHYQKTEIVVSNEDHLAHAVAELKSKLRGLQNTLASIQKLAEARSPKSGMLCATASRSLGAAVEALEGVA